MGATAAIVVIVEATATTIDGEEQLPTQLCRAGGKKRLQHSLAAQQPKLCARRQAVAIKKLPHA